MADLAQIERALRNADAAGDVDAARKLAAAYREAQAAVPVQATQPLSANAAPSIENDPTFQMPTAKEAALGFEQGVGNTLANAASLPDKIAEVFGAKPGAVSGAFGVSPQDFNTIRHPESVTTDFNGVKPNSGARFVGDMISSAPTFPLGPISGGAAAGALVTPENGNMATGAGLGAGLGALLRGLSGVIAPNVDPAVVRLRDAGVTMTPGQIFGNSGMVGKGVKRLEDIGAGLPLVGDIIGTAQNRSLEQAQRGAVNRALAPIGQELPVGMTGQEAVRTAGDVLSDNYSALLPGANVTLDAPFARTVSDAGARIDARLPDQMGGQFQSTLGDVFKKLNSTGPVQPSRYTGEAVHEAASDLGRMERSYSGGGGNDTQLAQGYGDVSRGLRDAITRSNPQLGPAIRANDEGWANLVRIEDASKAATGNASGKLPGVFTGQQLRTAARAGDNSVRDRATARGEALLQDYAEDMIRVLPSSVADSGTAGRAVIPLLAAGSASVSPAAAAGLAAVPLLYSRPGLELANATFARKAGPGATALADIFRRAAPPLAAANGGQR